jgi:hypothetical protein
MPNYASVTLRPRCYRSTQNGGLLDDVSSFVIDGTVRVDADAETPMTFAATVTDPSAFPALTWIAPTLTVEWWDPNENATVSITEQVGVYIVMPLGESHTANQGIGRIDGRDGTWVLKAAATQFGLGIASGTNVVTAVKSRLSSAGFTRSNIPAHPATFPKKVAPDAGTPLLDLVNGWLHRIGYDPLWFDRQGVPTSAPYRSPRKEQPARTISSANGDVVNTVTLDTDIGRLCNRVTVVRNDADGDPVFVTKTNDRADSPVSTVSLGLLIAKTIEASNIDSQAVADALATKTLEQGASVWTRLAVDTIPDPRFDVRDVIELDVRRDDGTVIADGRWYSDEVELPFRPSDPSSSGGGTQEGRPMRWRLNRLLPFSPEGG